MTQQNIEYRTRVETRNHACRRGAALNPKPVGGRQFNPKRGTRNLPVPTGKPETLNPERETRNLAPSYLFNFYVTSLTVGLPSGGATCAQNQAT